MVNIKKLNTSIPNLQPLPPCTGYMQEVTIFPARIHLSARVDFSWSLLNENLGE